MEEMKTFECAICGKKYKSLQDRINCETACLKEQKSIEAKKKDEAMKAECKKVDAAVAKLVEDYIKVSKDIKKLYDTYGEDVQLKSKDVKHELDLSFNDIVYDLINFIF